MTKEEAKALLPILQAYADGNTIQQKDYNLMDGSWEWTDVEDNEEIDLCGTYRIKPTSTYRPFANAEECWDEMKKHEPFGWVKEKEKNRYVNVKRIDGEFTTVLFGTDNNWGMEGAFNNYTFADGTVFGKITEDEK